MSYRAEFIDRVIQHVKVKYGLKLKRDHDRMLYYSGSQFVAATRTPATGDDFEKDVYFLANWLLDIYKSRKCIQYE